jgi:methyl-accepting chemotaxis protein
MNNISIKFKLYGLAGLIVVCLAVLSGISLNSFSKIKLLNETLVLVQKSKSDMLTLRRNEKDFLARLDLKYHDKFKKNFSYLVADLNQINQNTQLLDLNVGEDLTKLSQLIEAYKASFNEVVNINEKIGLNPKSGLRGKLRNSVHSAEDKLKALNEIQLTTDMLMLRRNEKDFMLRKLEKYIDKFNRNYIVFNKHLNNSELSFTTINNIDKEMKLYQAGFLALSEAYKQLGLTPKTGLHGKMRTTIHKTEEIFNALSSELSAKIAHENTNIYNSLLALTVMFMILIIGVTFIISRSINSRLGYLQSHLNQVVLSSGDLSAALKIEGKDEITTISELFNQFVANLKQTFSQIPVFSENLEHTSKKNTAISQQAYQLALVQQEKSDESLEAVRQMVLSTEEITSNIHIAASSAEKANQSAIKGKSAIENVGSSITILANKLQASVEITKSLEENSQNISTVLDVIRGIAEQTNLLALNAAIEAARAGEYGRGFAVVADEVRTLASRTQDSTTQIQSLIESLQTNVKNTVEVMQESSSSASSTAEDALNATQVLDEITNTVNEIFELNTTIASASEQQSVISTNISNGISDINTTAKEAAVQSNEASQSSTQINTISLELRSLIASYKL